MFENMNVGTISSQAAPEGVEGPTHRPRSPDRTVKAHESAAVKQCKRCGIEKALTAFQVNKRSDGSGKHSPTCKRCYLDAHNERYAANEHIRTARKAHAARWFAQNLERKRETDALRYAAKRDVILEQKKQYHTKNYAAQIKPYKDAYLAKPEVIESRREYQKQYHVSYYAEHKTDYLAKFVARRSAKDKAMPKWADRYVMAGLYRAARDLTQKTGIRHEVDHIVPLQSDTVCGLHVEHNLRIITRLENRRKGNRLVDDIC